MDRATRLRQIRRQCRQARRAHPDPVGAARVVCDTVLAEGWLTGARLVGASMADDGELDPAPLVAACRRQGATVCFPVIDERNRMRFAPVADGGRMRRGRFDIPEPDVAPEALLDAQHLDVVLVPLVAFDGSGNRAGRGGGYYDQALAFLLESPAPERPLLLGLAYEVQCAAELPTRPGDVPLDVVVTEQQVRVLQPDRVRAHMSDKVSTSRVRT